MTSNHTIAQALYVGKASDETYKEVFTRDELVELWDNHCAYRQDENGQLIEPDASYDDEVYNALDRLGYWDNK